MTVSCFNQVLPNSGACSSRSASPAAVHSLYQTSDYFSGGSFTDSQFHNNEFYVPPEVRQVVISLMADI